MNNQQIQELIHKTWFAVKNQPDIPQNVRDYVLLRLEEAAKGLDRSEEVTNGL